VIADIVSNKTGAADVFFLIAAILAAVAGLASNQPETIGARAIALGWASVALIALGLLFL
jgi:hypothetical protein